MPAVTMSLYRYDIRTDPLTLVNLALDIKGQAVIFAHKGTLGIDGKPLAEGAGMLAKAGAQICALSNEGATALVYLISKPDTPNPTPLASETFEFDFPCLLRLDEVVFPPGAQAYRHVHAGAGFRHLRWGALHLQADDHAFDAKPGDSWFEALASPVIATASKQEAETRFLRCMLIPPEYAGKSTFQLMDPEDAKRPRKQSTHLHFDLPLDTANLDTLDP